MTKRLEQLAATASEARECEDADLETQLSAAEGEVAELRRRLAVASLRHHVLEAERDRRAIQRRPT
jgi:DNA-binding FrmR family transcriptional regulator